MGKAMTDGQHHDSVSFMECPKCGSVDVRRSKTEGPWGTMQRLLGRWPFRCRSCRFKFYRRAEAPVDF